MKTAIGLALIFAIAYGLLRVLAWLGLCWERGYVFEPSGAKLAHLGHRYQPGFRYPPYMGMHNNDTGLIADPWFKDNGPWFEDDGPRFDPGVNIDGTPMIDGFVDANGNPYGITND